MVKFSTVLPIIAGLAGAAEAHTRVYSLWVNGVDQGDGRGVYVRSPPNNNPVKDVTSAGINCNVNNVAVAKSVSVAGGDTVTFEWYHDNRNDDIIDLSHLGPVTVYIAPSSSNGAGAVWTKLAESGLSNGVWAVQTLVKNGGKHDVKLPATLAPGDYLLRAEIIALHEAETDYTTNSARGAQFYPSCSQVKVTSGGTAVPPGTFNFIGGYTHADPGILFSIYNGATSYPIPGPAVWVPTGTNSASTSSKSSTTSTSTKPTSSAAATTTSAAPAATTPVTVSVAEKYHQCGGKGYTGATQCAAGLTCTKLNDYYYQCL